jgi:membrane-bound hydrogenase subunit beta
MENKIVKQLIDKFPYLEGKIRVQRVKCIISAALEKKEIREVLEFAWHNIGFIIPHVIVGVDDGEDLGVIYVFSNDEKILLALKLRIPKKDPVIKCISILFPSMLWYERELVDLFGIQITGLPDGPNYPLPDGWPKGNYPLRKEWNPAYFDRETMTYNEPKKEEESVDE